ncbi:hypothetical protein CsSME_00012845 [Camellia sinensis var. sinensis]
MEAEGLARGVARKRYRNNLGYHFELLPDAVTLSNSSLSIKNGGKFTIDCTGVSPASTPESNCDLRFGFHGHNFGTGLS